MRLRKIKNAKEKLEQFPKLVILDPLSYKNNWQSLFNNNNEIYLEIGMGKGKFIFEHAIKNPNINFIGLEKSDSILLKAARKIEDEKISNLKLLNFDASLLLDIFNEKSISKIFLNFSDPWPKARHEKRRLTSDLFLNIYKTILKDSGVIELKTDNRNLFEFSLIKFNEFGFKFLDLNLNLHESPNNEVITTEYEERFKLLENTIYYIKVAK